MYIHRFDSKLTSVVLTGPFGYLWGWLMACTCNLYGSEDLFDSPRIFDKPIKNMHFDTIFDLIIYH